VTWIRKRDHSLVSNAASLLVCGLLAGFVVAAAAFPAVALSGLAAKAGADTFDSLPTELSVLPSPQVSYVYASDAKTLLAMLYDENRRDVPLSSVAPVMQQAIVAAEDTRYYQHHGVDIKGVARALVANQQAGSTQGASTLTMQYVRQALAYSARTPQEVVDATVQSPARKLREMKYALAIEKKLTKQQILERYLNISAFGHGAYGIYAASQVYFGKEPSQLALPEAALLAGLVKAPSAYDPADPDKRQSALDRREYVLKQMVMMKYITQQQADDAKKAELKIIGQRTPQGCAAVLQTGAGFFCDNLVRWWKDQPAFGADAFERENRLRSGGYTIISSLDLKTQSALYSNTIRQVPIGSPYALMLAAVEPGTGHILGLATNRNYSLDQSHNGRNTNPYKRGQIGNYPNTVNPLVSGGGEIYGYQAGSSFKIFTLTAALEKGFPLDYGINTTSPYQSKYIVSGDAACPGTHFYCVENANPSYMNGQRNMWTGLGRSVNTYFVPLEERVGSDNAVAMAKRLGIQFRDPQDANLADHGNNQWGAFTLGVSATTPLDLVNAYAALNADGLYCKPIPVLEIRDSNGNKLDAAKPVCNQAVNPDVARGAMDAARCPLGDQSAFGRCDGATAADVRGIVGHPVAGKTGTTDNNWTATLVAMTKQIAIAGIVADADWPQSTRLAGAFGGDPHRPVNNAVKYALRDAMAGRPQVQFAPPSRGIAFGSRSGIPSVHCQSVDSAKAEIRAAGFSVDVASQQVQSDCPAGTVAKTDPSGDTARGSTVVIYISKGGGNPAPAPPGRGGGGGGGGGGGPPTIDPRCKIFPKLCRTPPPHGGGG
jgi:membrane peptidoglycan carboxypeptidase